MLTGIWYLFLRIARCAPTSWASPRQISRDIGHRKGAGANLSFYRLASSQKSSIPSTDRTAGWCFGCERGREN